MADSGTPIGSICSWFVAIGFPVAVVAGAVALRLLAMPAGNELSLDRALFASANAVTLTGLPADIGVDSFLGVGQMIVLMLTAVGAWVSLVAGGAGVSAVLGSRHRPARLIIAATVALVIASAIGFVCAASSDDAWIHWQFLTLGGFSNSGLLDRATIPLETPALSLVAIPLSIVGGLGLVVCLDVWDRLRDRTPVSRHTRFALVLTAAMLLAGTVLMGIPAGDRRSDADGQRGSERPAVQQFSTATLAGLNARSLGLPFEGERPSRGRIPILMTLMSIGGQPGGTAGGIKSLTLVVITIGLAKLLRGDPIQDTISASSLSTDTHRSTRRLKDAASSGGPSAGLLSRAPFAGSLVGRTFAVACLLAGALFANAAVTWAGLVAVSPQLPVDEAAFLAVSAASNSGLAIQRLAVVGDANHLLTASMLAGRMIPLLLLGWLVRHRELPASDLSPG